MCCAAVNSRCMRFSCSRAQHSTSDVCYAPRTPIRVECCWLRGSPGADGRVSDASALTPRRWPTQQGLRVRLKVDGPAPVFSLTPQWSSATCRRTRLLCKVSCLHRAVLLRPIVQRGGGAKARCPTATAIGLHSDILRTLPFAHFHVSEVKRVVRH